MYLVFLLIAFGIGLLIRFVIRPAIRRSSSASDLSIFRHHLAGLRHPFPLGEDETVVLSMVARDLGAIRNIVGESATQDAYPASFPLVYCTSARLVILMSTTDRPDSITGTYPGGQPRLDARIGEQFGGASGRFVSSVGWAWESFGMVIGDETEAGLSWTDREGIGVVTLGFVDAAEQSQFVAQAVALIEKRRSVVGLVPADAESTTEGSQTTSVFSDPLVVCAACSAHILDVDRFCVGCGEPVARMATA